MSRRRSLRRGLTSHCLLSDSRDNAASENGSGFMANSRSRGIACCVTGGNSVPNLRANFLFGKAKLIRLLKIHPEFRPRAKPRSEPQRGVGGDAAFASEDLCHAVGGYMQFPA